MYRPRIMHMYLHFDSFLLIEELINKYLFFVKPTYLENSH